MTKFSTFVAASLLLIHCLAAKKIIDKYRATAHPVVSFKVVDAKGRGIIGMKIIGNGSFTDPAEREKSIRFAMACRDIDAVVIGFTKTEQIDEAIQSINRALAEG